MTKCVFCERIEKGEYDDRYANHVMFTPLNPVHELQLSLRPLFLPIFNLP